MATQKQRRKRAKEKRHAYDLVEIDSEGNETVLSAGAIKSETAAPRESKASKGRKERRENRDHKETQEARPRSQSAAAEEIYT